MDRVAENKDRDGVVRTDSLAFLHFALSHASCGDGPVEVRVGERCLISWCPQCASLKVFCAPRS